MSEITLRVFQSESYIPSGSYGRYMKCVRSEAGTWFIDAGNWPRKAMGDRPFEVEVGEHSLIATMGEMGIETMPRDWCLRFGLTDVASYPKWLPLPYEVAPAGAWRAVIEKTTALQQRGRRVLAANSDAAYQAFCESGGDKAGQLVALAALGAA